MNELRATAETIVPNDTSSLKVAMACPGVGLVQRGFERMFRDLFDLLEHDLNVRLFKGGGPSRAHESKLLFISRNGWFLRWFPIHKLVGRTTQHVECFTFAISLLIAIRGEGYDVVHCTDPPLARILYKLRKLFGLKFRLLYTEACAMPASDCPPADHMHQISKVTFDEAVEFGIPEPYMTVIPLGFYPENFSVTASKNELREKYGLAEGTFVILCLAAINRYHKRIDYLVDEFKSIEGDVLLWIDGSLDQGDPDLIQYTKDALGDRCRVTLLPTSEVGELFKVADLMVHTSLFEAFGLAMVEGASTGLPVLTHNAKHYLWLMDNKDSAIDMSRSGNLSDRLNELIADRQQLVPMSKSEQIRERYSWVGLRSSYLEVYSKLAALPVEGIGIADRFGLK
ncbi:MAG: hypothetical protein COB20_09450 [SAR86 cluster bacterium]|uniref:Glycosyl transferase family 1 domain-containing protein n=1 Tax=SAR86 cluster bacterium TaxID=2030880 RepID=A0A2A4X2N7_9GAMM|nr:MAG: hypothetical protein COB20_09450 [SAR86 cluster bacterium]